MSEAMTAKEYLRQAYRLDRKINNCIEEAARLRELALSVTGPGFGERVQTSHSTEAPFVKRIEKAIALEGEINEEIDRLVDLKLEIIEVLHSVEDIDCRMVLEKRYLGYERWEEIATEMGISESWVLKLHRQGIKAVDVILRGKEAKKE